MQQSVEHAEQDNSRKILMKNSVFHRDPARDLTGEEHGDDFLVVESHHFGAWIHDSTKGSFVQQFIVKSVRTARALPQTHDVGGQRLMED